MQDDDPYCKTKIQKKKKKVNWKKQKKQKVFSEFIVKKGYKNSPAFPEREEIYFIQISFFIVFFCLLICQVYRSKDRLFLFFINPINPLVYVSSILQYSILWLVLLCLCSPVNKTLQRESNYLFVKHKQKEKIYCARRANILCTLSLHASRGGHKGFHGGGGGGS